MCDFLIIVSGDEDQKGKKYSENWNRETQTALEFLIYAERL